MRITRKNIEIPGLIPIFSFRLDWRLLIFALGSVAMVLSSSLGVERPLLFTVEIDHSSEEEEQSVKFLLTSKNLLRDFDAFIAGSDPRLPYRMGVGYYVKIEVEDLEGDEARVTASYEYANLRGWIKTAIEDTWILVPKMFSIDGETRVTLRKGRWRELRLGEAGTVRLKFEFQ